MQITKKIEWDMGHRIPNHKSKCRNPHGHRYVLEITVEGDIISEKGKSSEGMVIDFSDIKNILTSEVHDICDHGFMYWENDLEMSEFFHNHTDFKSIKVSFIPTAECISQWVFDCLNTKLQKFYKKSLTLVKVQLWETPTSSAITSL